MCSSHSSSARLPPTLPSRPFSIPDTLLVCDRPPLIHSSVVPRCTGGRFTVLLSPCSRDSALSSIGQFSLHLHSLCGAYAPCADRWCPTHTVFAGYRVHNLRTPYILTLHHSACIPACTACHPSHACPYSHPMYPRPIRPFSVHPTLATSRSPHALRHSVECGVRREQESNTRPAKMV
jgi:hypothetical protein